ncbi:hypothetical protein [Paenibacillus terrigena]|uniref:hypothetical protein n=1 Tax=Paenibacillus terrigena TaxID=369333 RepID=UPI000365E520|nr:hypothetical protein [Paenibacillus terrigena]
MNVQLTEKYRIKSDGMQFIVEERRIVDPTKAPNWSRIIADNPNADATPREVWRDIAYYGISVNSLILAIEYVILKTGITGRPKSLADLIGTLRSVSESIHTAMTTAISRDITVDLGVQIKAEGIR